MGKIRMNTFTIELHHGGQFATDKDYVYVGGRKETYEGIDGDYINVDKLFNLTKQLGYKKEFGLYVKMEGLSLKNGLELIHDDNSVRMSIEEAMKSGKMELYCDHEDNEEIPADSGNGNAQHGSKPVEDVVDVTVDAPMHREGSDSSRDDEKEDMGDEETDDGLSDASDDDGNEELITIRKKKQEIRNEKIQDLVVQCEVNIDKEAHVVGSAKAKEVGTSPVRKKSGKGKQVEGKSKGGTQPQQSSTTWMEKQGKKHRESKCAEQVEVEPTFCDDDDD